MMRLKKPLIRIIQVGTLFLISGISYFGIVSFSQPEVSKFWTVKQLETKFIQTAFAEDDEEKEDEEDYEDDDRDRRTNIIPAPIVTPPPVVQQNTNTTNVCKTVTTTVYDTVTSASGVTSQVPRQVTNQVCENTPAITPTVTPITNPPVPTSIDKITTLTPTVVDSLFKNEDLHDGTYRGTGKYSFPGGAIDYSVELTILDGKITNAQFVNFVQSGNGFYTKEQGDAVLQELIRTQNYNINAVTGASGTSKAIQDAINMALEKSKNSSAVQTGLPNKIREALKVRLDKVLKSVEVSLQIPKVNTLLLKITDKINVLEKNKLQTSDQSIIQILEYKISMYEDAKDIILAKKWELEENIGFLIPPKSYTGLNGKAYKLMYEGGVVVIKKVDGTYAKQTFQNYDDAISYLNQNAIPTPTKYVAPNGKSYTLMYEGGVVVIKKVDGTYAKQTFQDYKSATAYLDINAPKVVIVPVIRRVAVTSAKTTVTPVQTVKVTPPTVKPTPVTPPINTTTSAS